MSSKQAFIAMIFPPKDERLTHPNQEYESIKKAIKETGFQPLRIDDKPFNNGIADEILSQIEKSCFVVADLTKFLDIDSYTNKQPYGVYFEAGYAMGKGKNVIWCCRKKEFDNKEGVVHFDVKHIHFIVWKNPEDLYRKLKERIMETIIGN